MAERDPSTDEPVESGALEPDEDVPGEERPPTTDDPVEGSDRTDVDPADASRLP